MSGGGERVGCFIGVDTAGGGGVSEREMPVQHSTACALSQLFLKQVARQPKAPALKTSSETTNFSELHRRAVAIKDALVRLNNTTSQQRSSPTFTVAILCGNFQVTEICAVLAVILLGGCFVPLDDNLPEHRLLQVFEDAQPNSILISESLAAAQRKVPGRQVAAVVEAAKRHGCHVLTLEDSGEPCKSQEGASAFPESGKLTERDAQEKDVGRRPPAEAPVQPSGLADEESSSPVDGVTSNEQPVFGRGFPGSAVPSVERGLAGGEFSAGTEDGSRTPPREEEDLLYILYTSGTTGLPKGVRGTRSGALNRILFGWSLCAFRDDGELVCRRTPSCFVDFVAEALCPLLAGIPMFLPPRGAHADPLVLVPALAKAKVTRITLTPSLLASLLRTSDAKPLLPDLHTWFISGEALHPDLALLFRRRAAPGAQLVNLYGSTEVSGDATFCTLDEIVHTRRDSSDPMAAGDEGVLIGKPLPGVYLAIVSPERKVVPAGQAGELLVGGVGVALGYHRRPQETADKFLRSVAHRADREGKGVIHIPGLEPGRRVVRTGDRVVQPVDDGPLFWLGKLDGEVKVRGVRVSLEEVEVLACRATGLPAGAFAVTFDQGTQEPSYSGDDNAIVDGTTAVATSAPDRGRLIGFFVPNGTSERLDGPKLRLQLAEKMNPSQLPAVLVPVDGEFPLTTTGKVDRRALLRQHRKQLPWIVDGQPRIFQDDERVNLPHTKNAQDTGALGSAREAIARGVVAVLPHARDSIASWLANSEPGAQQGSGLHLSFTGLGGTSLLAVEAAWRASRSLASRDTLSVVRPLPGPLVLTAEDFLRGNLEEAVATLHGRLRTAPRVSTEASTVIATAGLATTYTEPAGSAADHVGAASQVPVVPGATLPSVAHYSSAGRKRRRREVGNSDQLLRSRPFLAVHRAGAGFRHSRACLGGEPAITGVGRGAQGARVELNIRWSSCLSKCIDATPLVVVRKSTKDMADLPRTEPSGTTGGMAKETVSPECCCHGLVSDAGGSVAAEDTRSSRDRGDPVAHEVGQQTVYIGSHSGEFQALDLATGNRDWSFTAGGRIESGAACSWNGLLVFIGCHDRHLYALNRRTGALTWSFETGDAIKCTPLCLPIVPYSDLAEQKTTSQRLDYGVVLVGSHDGILRSLCEADGDLRWSFDCGGALFASPAQDADARVVYAATTKGRMVALDTSMLVSTEVKINAGCSATDATTQHNHCGPSPKHPTLLWERQLPAPCFSTPVVCDANGYVVLGCVDGGLYCLSSTGEQVWVCRGGNKPVFSSPCLLPPLHKENNSSDTTGRMRVVWGCHDGSVRCQSGVEVAWEADIGRGQPVFSSPCFASVACTGCTVLCPLLFACSVPGTISVLWSVSGALVGEKQLPGEVFSSAVVVGRTLVVGCRDNLVYVLDILVKCTRCVQTT